MGRDTESDEDLAVRAERARKSNWQNCWKHMTLKDLTGWPLWEQELHDILEPAFSDLQVHIPRTRHAHACVHTYIDRGHQLLHIYIGVLNAYLHIRMCTRTSRARAVGLRPLLQLVDPGY